MSKSLASTILGKELLTLTHKFLKLPLGRMVESCGTAQNIPIFIKKVTTLLNLFIFDMEEVYLLNITPTHKILGRIS